MKRYTMSCMHTSIASRRFLRSSIVTDKRSLPLFLLTHAIIPILKGSEAKWANSGEKEHVRARFIVENTRFLRQISRVLSHSTAPNRSLPVRSKIKLREERFDCVRVQTFGY